jgi:L-asparaginase
MSVRILITGGTFDKEYDEIKGKLFFDKTHIEELLKLGRCRLEVNITTLMLIDSLTMSNKERSYIKNSCKKVDEKQIVITHGTDTMTKTARVLAKEKLDKTIILTGAMIPYNFGSSDGLFNVGSALAFSQALPAGVYIAMNGKYFDWDSVKKNKETGVFEKI